MLKAAVENMPIDAGALGGIRPVNQPQRSGGTDSVQRREEGSSSGGFRPQTNVALKTAVDDMAGILSKISTSEKLGLEKLPQEVSQIVRNVLQQAFSMESTLSQGIGSTLESQRFSMEQLSVFARMLTQIGALAEKGFSMELNSETELLLKNFKAMLVSEEGGSTLEPVLLSKAAFELIDNKNAVDLPQNLYAILAQLAQGTAMQMPMPQASQSEGMQFLNQLVKFFMPRPQSSESSAQPNQEGQQGQQGQQSQQSQQTNQSQARQFLQSMFNNLKSAVSNNQAQNQAQGQNQSQPQSQPNQANQQTPQNTQSQPNQQAPQGQSNLQNQAQNQPNQSTNQNQPQMQNQPQSQSQPNQANQQMPQNQNQPQMQNQSQPQNQPNQANQQMPQNQNQPQMQNQPQSQNQPNQTNQQMPQNQQQMQNQPQSQNQPNQANQQMPQNQNQPQMQQNQSQPQNQPNQTNQQMPQNQNQPQMQNQPQSQPNQANQQTPQNQNQQQMQNQPQGQNSLQQFRNVQRAQQYVQNQPLQEQEGQYQKLHQQQQSQQNQGDEFLAKQQQLKFDLQAAKTMLLKQPLQNTPQTMDVMKNLAQFLMKDQNLTPKDSALLQNFINNNQSMMNEGEARHLQNLLRLCQQNVPLTVQQAAVQQNLPDLPRLWAFMQLCDMAMLTSKLSAKAFKRAGRDVAEFTNAMRQAMGGDNSSVQNQRSFQMMLPLYLGDNEASYPTYLHVYDENERDKETGEDKKETWVRICVLTDNIGAVELTFRIYEGNQLDMRFYFSQKSAANEFRTYVPALRDSLKETNLNVGEVRIGSVGEKMLES